MPDISIFEVDQEERISRFILNPRHFNAEKGNIKAQAFKPQEPKPERPERQISVYRTEYCSNSEIWQLGDEHVANPQANRFVLGRGDLKGQEVFDENLYIVPDPHPNYRHANIVNWPDSERELRELIAVKLSQKARLFVRDSPN